MEEIDHSILKEEADFINDRNYTVRGRPDHLNIWTDKEFFVRFHFLKVIVRHIL